MYLLLSPLLSIFNIGMVTLNQSITFELIGGPVTYIPKRPGEPDITHADISKAVQLLGYSLKFPSKMVLTRYYKISIIGEMPRFGHLPLLLKPQRYGIITFLEIIAHGCLKLTHISKLSPQHAITSLILFQIMIQPIIL